MPTTAADIDRRILTLLTQTSTSKLGELADGASATPTISAQANRQAFAYDAARFLCRSCIPVPAVATGTLTSAGKLFRLSTLTITAINGQTASLPTGSEMFGASQVLVGGAVTAIVITNTGSGYGSSPSVTFSAPGGSGGRTATGTAVLTAGAVTSVTITDGGAGYTSPPTITFGSGAATATAVITPVLLERVGAPLFRNMFPSSTPPAIPPATVTNWCRRGRTDTIEFGPSVVNPINFKVEGYVLPGPLGNVGTDTIGFSPFFPDDVVLDIICPIAAFYVAVQSSDDAQIAARVPVLAQLANDAISREFDQLVYTQPDVAKWLYGAQPTFLMSSGQSGSQATQGG